MTTFTENTGSSLPPGEASPNSSLPPTNGGTAVPLDIHKLANEMVVAGFTGQNMFSPEQAGDYILMAAHNPNIEAELPEKGFAFWRVCAFKFRLWQARRHFGRDGETTGGGDRS